MGGSYLADIMCSDKNGNTHLSQRVFTGVCDSFASATGFHPIWNVSLNGHSSQITGALPYTSNFSPCLTYSIDGDGNLSGGCGYDFWDSSNAENESPSVGYSQEATYGSGGYYGSPAEGRTWGTVTGTCTCTHCSGTQPLDANNQNCRCRSSSTYPSNNRYTGDPCVIDEECHTGSGLGHCASGVCSQ